MSVCRISVQTEFDGRTVDVAVCAQTQVGALLPAIVDLLAQPSTPEVVHGWRLDRPAGAPLDESLSLTDNDVHDGDLVVLTTTHAPTLGRVSVGSARTAAASSDPAPKSAVPLRESACAWAVLVAAAALAWTGAATGATGHLGAAACGAGVVCGVAFVRRSAAISVAGCAPAATTGFLAVPSGPGSANVFLSATVVFTVAVVMTRLSARRSAPLIATACCAALVAITTGIAVFTAMGLATVGAVLVTGALGLLTLAPRLSAAMAGLGPQSEADPAEAVEARAHSAHATLTGVVAGCALGVMAGTILVAAGSLRAETSPVAGAAFGFVTGLVLLLRTRTYVDAARRLVLVTCGLPCATAALVVVCAVGPQWATWAAVALTAIGVGALRRRAPTPFGSRLVDVIDYAALAIVVPLACWVIGVYGLARDWHLA